MFDDDLSSIRKLLHTQPCKTRMGKYEIVDTLGQGGMGRVYRAYDTELARTVAIKIIYPGADHSVQKRRVLKEAKATARLSHPNIVKVYEIGEEKDICYLVMEYIQGCTLSDVLKKGIPPEDWTCKLFAQIAKAVYHAHQEGIIHRDLKPANIMILPDDSPKVMDFGLAKIQDVETSASSKDKMIGTIYYMSPEQVLATKIDIRSDIFALGIILYEMLTGQKPFLGRNTLEIAMGIAEKEPIHPKLLVHALSLDVAAICMKCLYKDKKQRYQNANLLAKDIDRYVQCMPVSARANTLWYRMGKWLSRNHSLLKKVGIFLFICLLIFSNFHFYYRSQKNSSPQEKATEPLPSSEVIPVAAKTPLSEPKEPVLLAPTQESTSTVHEYVKSTLAEIWDGLSKVQMAEDFAKLEKKIKLLHSLAPQYSLLYEETAKLFLVQSIRCNQLYLLQPMLDNFDMAIKLGAADERNVFCLFEICNFYPIIEKKKQYQSYLCKKNAKYENYFQARDLWNQCNPDQRSEILSLHPEIIQLCENALKENPHLASAYDLMARICYESNLEKALVLSQKAIALYEKQSYSVCFPQYKDSIKEDVSFLTPLYLELLYFQSKIYEKRQEPESAIACLNRCIQYAPCTPSWGMKRGEAYYHQGKFELAILDFSKAIADGADAFLVCEKRGSSYFQCKNYAKALEDFNYLIECKPQKSEFYLLRANVYQEQKLYKEAIQDIDYALQLSPHNKKIYLARKIIYNLANQKLSE